MNRVRWLFRAWIIVFALWIGLVTYLYVGSSVGAQYTPTAHLKKGYTPEEYSKVIDGPGAPNFYNYVHSPSAEKLTIEFIQPGRSITNKNFLSVGFPDGTELFIPRGYNETDRNYIAQQFWQQRWSHWKTATKDVAIFALLPYVLLFALGYALLWVGRGLRRA
jgi:hypothetical protein